MSLQPRVCDLAGALTRMGGDRDLLRRMVEFFREDAPGYLARLHAARDEGNPGAVQYAAHCLHGLVANFGAEAASLAAQRVEDLSHAGNPASVAEAVEALDGEIARLEASLTRDVTAC